MDKRMRQILSLVRRAATLRIIQPQISLPRHHPPEQRPAPPSTPPRSYRKGYSKTPRCAPSYLHRAARYSSSYRSPLYQLRPRPRIAIMQQPANLHAPHQRPRLPRSHRRIQMPNRLRKTPIDSAASSSPASHSHKHWTHPAPPPPADSSPPPAQTPAPQYASSANAPTPGAPAHPPHASLSTRANPASSTGIISSSFAAAIFAASLLSSPSTWKFSTHNIAASNCPSCAGPYTGLPFNTSP